MNVWLPRETKGKDKRGWGRIVSFHVESRNLWTEWEKRLNETPANWCHPAAGATRQDERLPKRSVKNVKERAERQIKTGRGESPAGFRACDVYELLSHTCFTRRNPIKGCQDWFTASFLSLISLNNQNVVSASAPFPHTQFMLSTLVTIC